MIGPVAPIASDPFVHLDQSVGSQRVDPALGIRPDLDKADFRSTRRCRDTVGWVSPGRVATSSPAVRSPPVRASSSARLLGSATAAKTSMPPVSDSIYIDANLYGVWPPLDQHRLRRGTDEPLPVEHLGRCDPDAVRSDRAAGPQCEIVAVGKSMQMNNGVGVHEDELGRDRVPRRRRWRSRQPWPAVAAPSSARRPRVAPAG